MIALGKVVVDGARWWLELVDRCLDVCDGLLDDLVDEMVRHPSLFVLVELGLVLASLLAVASLIQVAR